MLGTLEPSLTYGPISTETIALIKEAVGEQSVIVDRQRRESFGRDATEYYHLPDLVVEARSADDVQAVLRLANRHGFPVIPRGTGTGLAGGSVPISGGVVLSLEKMNRILSIDRENLLAVVEPGVVNGDLKRAVQAEGLFYPPDPASYDTCSLGGNIATNAGGASCIKYGTTRDYVLGLEAVLANGERLTTGTQTRKGVVGYDLVHLLVGSEGTLGIITKIILKLIPLPPAVTTLTALFPDLPSAMRAVSMIIANGQVPCAMEFLDSHCLKLIGDLLPFREAGASGAFLLIEFDGLWGIIEKNAERAGELCLKSGAFNVFLAPDSYKRSQMWGVRKEVSLRIEQSSGLYIPEDVVVPICRIAEFVSLLPEFEERYGMRIYSFGHAGDGNIHLNITAENQESRERVEEGIHHVLSTVISMGGTISGEHGIGIAKKRFLHLELSAESIRIQREIKRIFDPRLVLNPGKIFDF